MYPSMIAPTVSLSNCRYYSGYLQFFQDQVLQHGMGSVLDKYVFSPDANEEKSAMFARLFSGLVHPLIHFGHGPEFGLPGLAAEGAAHGAKTLMSFLIIYEQDWRWPP